MQAAGIGGVSCLYSPVFPVAGHRVRNIPPGQGSQGQQCLEGPGRCARARWPVGEEPGSLERLLQRSGPPRSSGSSRPRGTSAPCGQISQFSNPEAGFL